MPTGTPDNQTDEIGRPEVGRVEQGVLAEPEPGWEEIGYGGPQVCKIVGISYRQLDYWARTNLLRPSLADAAGSGTQRRYSYRDLVALKVIKSLLDAGIKHAMLLEIFTDTGIGTEIVK